MTKGSKKRFADALPRCEDLLELVRRKGLDSKAVRKQLAYEAELEQLQIELARFHADVQTKGRRVLVVLEGRDAAGKGGAIRRFTNHLNPRGFRVVALPKPSDLERGQWYFQRYVARLPAAGELTFFDRSWYNRAVVEPVNGFCDGGQYQRFLSQVPEFERLLVEDGIELVKLWFEISKDEQKQRFADRKASLLKQWKLGPVDAKAQKLWDRYTEYQAAMFAKTHTAFSPWVVVQANSKKKARLESIRTVLHTLGYDGAGGTGVRLEPDPEVVGPPETPTK